MSHFGPWLGPIREASDDHFYGPWKGGAKGSGGRPGNPATDMAARASYNDRWHDEQAAGRMRRLESGAIPSGILDGERVELHGPAGPDKYKVSRASGRRLEEVPRSRVTDVRDRWDAMRSWDGPTPARRRITDYSGKKPLVLYEAGSDDHFYGPWRGGSKAAGGRPATGGGATAPNPAKARDRWSDHDALISEMEAKYPGAEFSDAKKMPLTIANDSVDAIDTLNDRFGVPPNFQGIRVKDAQPGLYAEVKRVNQDVPGSAVYLYTPFKSQAGMDAITAQNAGSKHFVQGTAQGPREFTRGIVIHEMGHQYLGLNYHSRLGANRDAAVRKDLEPWLVGLHSGYPTAHISKYARRPGGHEAWAEAFTAAVTGWPTQSGAKDKIDYPKTLAAILDKHYPVTYAEAFAEADMGKVPMNLDATMAYKQFVAENDHMCGFMWQHPELWEAKVKEADDDHFYGPWSGGPKGSGGHPGGKGGGTAEPVKGGGRWPQPDLSRQGIEDATSAWSGIHYADLRSYARTRRIRPGSSLKDDPIHGISTERAAKSVATLTHAVANGPDAPPLYRGLRPRKEVAERFAALKPGMSFDMPLTSWSSSSEQAGRFSSGITGRGPTAVNISLAGGAKGFNMTRHSHYPQEKEWLTDGRFTVKSVTRAADGSVNVALIQEAVFVTPTEMGGLR